MELNITRENKNTTRPLSQVTFGSCVFIDNEYYILSNHDHIALLVNLRNGFEKTLPFNTKVHVVEDARIGGVLKI